MPQPTPFRRKIQAALRSEVTPDHLGDEESALYEQIVRAYHLSDEVSRRILAEGLTSLQTARLCRETIAQQGLTVKSQRGAIRAHPLLTVERDSRAAALSAFKQLNLELPHLGKKPQW
jgi:hypothetical protein